MDKQLGLLIDLQDIDLQIQKLEKREKEIPLQMKELEKESESCRHSYESKVKSVEGIEKDRRRNERELESKESGLAKLKDQLLSVKTNREYQALLHEIENIKNDISQLEEAILLLIEDAEAAGRAIKETRSEMEESQKLFVEQKKKKEQELELLRQNKRNLDSRKEGIRKELSDELIKRYDKIIQSRNGLAVVMAKDGSCQGCFMNLMPQLFQEVKQNVQIYSCPHCHRIIYYREEKEPE
ncbi:MAG: C4-type zinc ribbon domain-containing protein [bacterium]